MRVLFLAVVVTLVQCTSVKNNDSATRSAASTKMILDKSGYLYDPTDRSCDGFPRLMVETMPGTCLGMVLPRDRALDPATQKGFIKPRTILQLPGAFQFLVVDMGGWSPKNGRLFLLKAGASGTYELSLIKAGLDNPHGLRMGPDGFIYIGEKNQISKFHFVNGKIADWRLVFGNMPRKEGYMHPLSQFTFDPRNGDLYINSGSPSDHCIVEGTGEYKYCSEDQAQGNGAIYRIPAQKLKNMGPEGVEVFEYAAAGLRNSMAMVVSSAGYLVQGENSRDFPELEEPYEEMNVIDLNDGRIAHFGWPYCYDFHATSPEWEFPENKNLPIHKQFRKPVDCSVKEGRRMGEYQAPYILMPPHVAPLHMDYYRGSMFSDILGGKLLVTWHGYQPSGQRLVAYNVDEKGLPVLDSSAANARYQFNQPGTCPVSKPFQPRGGMDRHATYTEVISKWNEVKGIRPKGAPVGFTEASDGSIWIVEDRENRTIVRLARTQNANYREACDRSAASFDPQVQMLAWRSAVKSNPELDKGYQVIQSQLIQKYCTGCHGNLQVDDIAKDRFSNLDFLVKNGWIVPQDLEHSKAYGAIARLEGYTPMPPLDKPQFFGTPEGQQLNLLLSKWLNALPKDIDLSYAKYTAKDKRNIRLQPTTTAKACGQLNPGDIVYVDPRLSKVVSQDGYKWSRVYMVPAHSRLFKGACPAPEDGVYYIAQ
ncbi:L-sorbosone dehydrogenase [Bdellovibrio sp. SKB1291214]|uniref:PQQ-dependent sugar dehydrogenase n=1 Tax=Bdellovibrio sp. SKB1291214 TaxID=1732569 RepID=UPI000B51B395|nr:L-sorbosone dehydrogenase [Bdellovibrio sp. SKB1291214]UYL10154.1 L-sorbosone dehydrogenase [Bdellovibrio sp. SKB1291214]